MNPIIVSYVNEPKADLLAQSAERYGWPIRLMLEPGQYRGANHKFKTIIGLIQQLRFLNFTHIVSLDGFDTIVKGTPDDFKKAMIELGNPQIVLAAETNLYPPDRLEHLRGEFPETGTRYKYVNSPFILNIQNEVNKDFLEIGDEDDQVFLNKLYLKYKELPTVIKLDSNQTIIQTLYNVPRDHFVKHEGRWYNSETGRFPIFFHGNGKSDMSWLIDDNFVRPNKVLIGVRTGEFGRKSEWFSSFNAIHKPEGSVLSMVHGQSPARNANVLIAQALELNCTHLFFNDDDNIPADPMIISKLLAHNVDIVTGLYFMRNAPHRPCIFDVAQDDGKCSHHFMKPGESGLIPIVNCGFGAVLIKTEVFRKMKEAFPDKPWVTLGEAEPDHWCDDITFFNRARKLGFKLFCDLEQRVGHHHTITIWPERAPNGQWMTIYDSGGTHRFGIPAPTHHPADPAFAGKNDINLPEAP